MNDESKRCDLVSIIERANVSKFPCSSDELRHLGLLFCTIIKSIIDPFGFFKFGLVTLQFDVVFKNLLHECDV